MFTARTESSHSTHRVLGIHRDQWQAIQVGMILLKCYPRAQRAGINSLVMEMPDRNRVTAWKWVAASKDQVKF